MLTKLSPTRRNWILAGLGILSAYFAWQIRAVLNPLIAAYFLAYVLHPLVLRLQGRGWSRVRSVNTIFVIAALSWTGISFGIGAQASHLGQELTTPQWRERQIEKVDSFLEENQDLVVWVFDAFGAPLVEGEVPDSRAVFEELQAQVAERSTGTGPVAFSMWERAKRVFGGLLTLFSFIVLLPIYTYFLLFELERIHAFVRRYLPKRERERISVVSGQVGEVIGNFFRGRLTVCLIKGVVISAGLALAGVDYALLLGMGAGFLALVPFFGPFLAFLTAFLLALQQPASGGGEELSLFGALWRTGLVFGLAEVFEGYYLTPKILGESLGLHPVVVLVSIFAGGAAFGMFGVLLALPVTAALVILFREFVLPALAKFADEEP